jgi:hypothetical protein
LRRWSKRRRRRLILKLGKLRRIVLSLFKLEIGVIRSFIIGEQ